ncbi:DUF5694 domain-containing protein [Halorubellus salinus]|uniref:DUF5694 domain-containing protein n=1 Tax=Halorubellus salinus TaxID=755309 RepID=UPI001D0993B0|nr:DUF5694 domain-containing protein [Halorubellus salinus]
MQRPNAAARKTPTWPTPTPEQVEVVLLGTHHMDEPGLDAVNVDVDNVLDPERQRELETLAGRLEAVDPDHVAVERPAARVDELNEVYARYRDGDVAFDEEHAFDPRHPERDDETMACRSEVVQIGFRLAARLGHERVLPVDVPQTLGDDEDVEALQESGYEPEPKVDVPRVDPAELQASLDERLAESTVTGYLRYLNEEAALHANDGMFDEFVRFGDGENYAGPDQLAKWYRRNLRMVHNVWKGIESGDDRVLFVVGSGHVHVLRHLLAETPQFCPASALPYLPREG